MTPLKSPLMLVLMLLMLSILALPAYAQAQTNVNSNSTVNSNVNDTDDTGTFDINKVYEYAASAADDSALAQGNLGGSGAYPRRQENYALVLLRMIGYLVVVTAVILAAAWGIRKIGVAGVSKVGGGSNMDTIEAIYFGQNRGAVLVRVGDVVYLLGHTPDNIVLLEKIEGEKAVELIASSKGGSTVTSFKDAFNNFMGKMKKS